MRSLEAEVSRGESFGGRLCALTRGLLPEPIRLPPRGRETDSQKAKTPMMRRTAAALDPAADRPRKFSRNHVSARTGAPFHSTRRRVLATATGVFQGLVELDETRMESNETLPGLDETFVGLDETFSEPTRLSSDSARLSSRSGRVSPGSTRPSQNSTKVSSDSTSLSTTR